MKKQMETIMTTLFIALLFISCKEEKKRTEENNHSEHKMEEKSKPNVKKKVLSPHTETMAMIGDAHIHIDYSSPGVRGRIIFGGLVGYDHVWQAGAHKATWIETNMDLVINGELLPKGKYGFFTIPSKEDWTIMINKNWDQHGKDEYDKNDDVVRFKVTPSISNETTEHLEYKVNKVSEEEGSISFAWEKVTLKFNFKVKN